MRRSFARIGVVLVAATGSALISLGVASPASAGRYDCDPGEYCTYNDFAYSGGRFTTESTTPDYDGVDAWTKLPVTGTLVPVTLNDRVSSYRNNGNPHTYSVVASYEHRYGGGRLLWKAPLGANSRYVGDNNNDRASGHYWVRS
ncbi:Peptidase inhibitor family I36 [Amycolatopsis marina]|uniref:Peptidase inhibitor family I36 n=1 Tax=Amycolatopsis marina TaxID=490629 RepID=A0A1I1B2H8_9PSEU|nr:peptidase inhibitor family I36 protein [Amycolatopsis marina]SFB42733.1 Peptidase inhibitor family I36 [Amycolatopsis marina]